jgi:FKBP-type peptidyl-prolyl cis-trans isomerase (trigger factor)
MQSDELAGLMGRFGPEFKQSFQNRAQANKRAVTVYDNIITNRNIVAHEESINVTLRELRQSYEEGHIVLDFLEETINETYPT